MARGGQHFSKTCPPKAIFVDGGQQMARKYIPRSRFLQKGDNIRPKKVSPKSDLCQWGTTIHSKACPPEAFLVKGGQHFFRIYPPNAVFAKGGQQFTLIITARSGLTLPYQSLENRVAVSYRAHGIFCVCICADLVSVFRRHDGTADNDFGAGLFLTEKLNGIFH